MRVGGRTFVQIRHEKPVLTCSYKQEIAVPSVLIEGSAGRLNPPTPTPRADPALRDSELAGREWDWELRVLKSCCDGSGAPFGPAAAQIMDLG